MNVAAQFILMIRAATIAYQPWSHETLPPFQLLPKPDPRIVTWRDAVMEELRDHVLEPLPVWPVRQIRHDARKLESILRDEYTRLLAVKKVATAESSKSKTKRQGKKRRHKRTNTRLTGRQQQALELFIQYKNITRVAKAMGLSHSTASEHIKAAQKKLGDRYRKVPLGRTTKLPEDKRGNVDVASEESDNYDDLDD